jgi:hypothetical protein
MSKTLIYSGNSISDLTKQMCRSVYDVVLVPYVFYFEMLEKSFCVCDFNHTFFRGAKIFPFIEDASKCYKCGKSIGQYYICSKHIKLVQMLGRMEE